MSNMTYHSIDLKNNASNRSQEDFSRTAISQREERIEGKNREIVWSALLLTLPLLILTCVFFAFVFGYQVDIEDAPFERLKGNGSALDDGSAYYVNLSATFLIFLASWMSSLAPMLTGVAITLAAYPVAGKLLEDTTSQNPEKLMTPFQFNLAVRLIDGSAWSGLWNVTRYRFGWGKRNRSHSGALAALIRMTLIFVSLR